MIFTHQTQCQCDISPWTKRYFAYNFCVLDQKLSMCTQVACLKLNPEIV